MERLTSNSRVPHMARGLDVSEQLNKSLNIFGGRECVFEIVRLWRRLLFWDYICLHNSAAPSSQPWSRSSCIKLLT